VPEYLSPAWFDAADRALRADPGLAEASHRTTLVLQQTVDDPPTSTTWHIRIAEGSVGLSPGQADDATVTFRCDRATAVEIHQGRTSAQAAFMAGALQVGGDIGALLAHQDLLTGLGDVLAPLREPSA
jgi:hypothetical protein